MLSVRPGDTYIINYKIILYLIVLINKEGRLL